MQLSMFGWSPPPPAPPPCDWIIPVGRLADRQGGSPVMQLSMFGWYPPPPDSYVIAITTHRCKCFEACSASTGKQVASRYGDEWP